MPKELCISVTLLTDRYHGQEWPPSPARLVQALIGGTMTGGYRQHEPKLAESMQWLESLEPPVIVAVMAEPQAEYRIAVPNNDADSVAKDWASRALRGDKAKEKKTASLAEIRTMKSVAAKTLEVRHPHLRYLWNVEEEDEDAVRRHADSIRTVARCLHTLGWGIDMAYADASFIAGEGRHEGERWLPSRFSTAATLAVPVPGFFQDVQASYARYLGRISGNGVNPDARPTMYALQPYAKQGSIRRPFCAFGLEAVQFDPLQPSKPYSRRSHESTLVAAWARNAAGLRVPPGTAAEIRDGLVLGHVTEGDRSRRLSYVPLPSIGHANADGRIRRLMMVAPDLEVEELLAALRQRLTGYSLTDEKSGPVCQLVELPRRDPVRDLYTSKARFWTSVTPVVLHGLNGTGGKISVPKTVKLLTQSIVESGHEEGSFEIVAFQNAPFWPNLPSAAQAVTPLHLRRYPRYHIAVRFREAVQGPVLIGIGRHMGLGLLAPARE